MKNCKHYISEYDNIRVELEPLFGNQMDIISKYIKKNTILSDLKIKIVLGVFMDQTDIKKNMFN